VPVVKHLLAVIALLGALTTAAPAQSPAPSLQSSVRADECPTIAPYFNSRDGLNYTLAFTSSSPLTTDIQVSFQTRGETYLLSMPTVSIDRDKPFLKDRYRTRPYVFTNPAHEPLLAYSVSTSGSRCKQGSGMMMFWCPGNRPRFSSPAGELKTFYEELDAEVEATSKVAAPALVNKQGYQQPATFAMVFC